MTACVVCAGRATIAELPDLYEPATFLVDVTLCKGHMNEWLDRDDRA